MFTKYLCNLSKKFILGSITTIYIKGTNYYIRK